MLLYVSDSLVGCQKGALWWGGNAAAADERKQTLSHPQERRHNIKVEKAADPLADTPNEANAGSTIWTLNLHFVKKKNLNGTAEWWLAIKKEIVAAFQILLEKGCLTLASLPSESQFASDAHAAITQQFFPNCACLFFHF